MKKVIHTEKAPAAVGPYSQAIQAGNTVYVSGQIPLDPATGTLVDGDIQAQTKRIFENIRAILQEAGGDLSNIVKTFVCLTDISDFGKVNETYATFFTDAFPARSCVEVSNLPKGAQIEIECVAVL